jgi:hypothetical protein
MHDVRSTRAVDGWIQRAIERLDGDAVPFPDMHWRLPDGTLVGDHRGVYAAQSAVLAEIVGGGGVCGGGDDDMMDNGDSGPPREVEAVGCLAYADLFSMVRVYCHTGVTTYGPTESPAVLLKRYQCFDLFGMDAPRDVIQSVLLKRLDIHSALLVFDRLSTREYADTTMGVEVDAFIKRHISEAGRSALAQLTVDCLPHLCDVMSAADVNVDEGRLMNSLYALCDRRAHGAAGQLFMRDLGGGRSLWRCVRLRGLTVDTILSFRATWPGALDDTFYMTLIEVARTGTASEQQLAVLRREGDAAAALAPPRHAVAVSGYPRDVPMTQCDSPSFVYTHWGDSSVDVTYAVIMYAKGGQVRLPPFTCHGNVVMQCTAVFQSNFLTMTGAAAVHAHGGRGDESELVVTVYPINFRHARWNKATAGVTTGSDFRLSKIISLGALETDGYKFSPQTYPNFSPGGHVMLKIVVAKSSQTK